MLGDDVLLYRASRIENNQANKKAIMIGSHCRVLGQLLVFRDGGNIRIGESCFIGEDSRIWSAIGIEIGSGVLISHGVNIHDTVSHSLSAASRRQHIRQIFSTGHPSTFEDPPARATIVIEDDVWLGFNSTVLKGVTIGRGAVVGAASMVTKDVAPFSVVVGNPARVIGHAKP